MNVIIADYEKNGYDDSNFFYTILNTESKEINQVCYMSTRASGRTYPEDLNAILVKDLAKEHHEEFINAYIEASSKQLLAREDLMVEDEVVVVAGRKYTKGITFKISSFSTFYARNGDIIQYLHSLEGYKIASHNVELKSRVVKDSYLERFRLDANSYLPKAEVEVKEPTIEELTQSYIELLKDHDWYYPYAEGHAYYEGRKEHDEIMKLSSKVDKDLKIFSQYRKD